MIQWDGDLGLCPMGRPGPARSDRRPGHVLRPDARPVVGDGKGRLAGVRADRDPDLATRGRVSDRVVDEDHDQLPEACRIPGAGRGLRIHDDPDAAIGSRLKK